MEHQHSPSDPHGVAPGASSSHAGTSHAGTSHADSGHADSWHTHTEVQQVAGHDGGHDRSHGGGASHGLHIQHMQVFLFSLAGFMLIVVTVVATTLYFNWYKSGLKFDREEMVKLHEPAIAARASVEGAMKGYSASDIEPGKVRIPMDKAKERVIQLYNRPSGS